MTVTRQTPSPERDAHILYVAAVSEELGDLPGESLGVGALVAGVQMARLLSELRPRGVIMVGTGGAYEGSVPIGSACVARRVGYTSSAARMGLGYTPRPPDPVLCEQSLVEESGLPVVDVLTVSAITTDRLLGQRLADGWQVEHLEAFGAAWACAQAQVPFALVLGISNEVGPEAHVQWLTHRDAAQDAARLAVSPLSSSSQ